MPFASDNLNSYFIKIKLAFMLNLFGLVNFNPWYSIWNHHYFLAETLYEKTLAFPSVLHKRIYDFDTFLIGILQILKPSIHKLGRLSQ